MKEIQSLAGLLNFLHRAIVLGCAFTRRMYSKFSGATVQNMKDYHHLRLDGEFKWDCQVWTEFLGQGRLSVCRPFIDLDTSLNAEILDLYTDAAKGENLGMGGVFNRHWFFAKWEPGFIRENDPSIEYLELLGVCTVMFIWAKSHLSNRRIVLFCDNQPIVQMVNSTSAKCPNCMLLIRKLTLLSLSINTRVFAKWV